MLTAMEIRKRCRIGEIDWSGELRGDGLLLTLGDTIQPLRPTGSPVDLGDQASIDALYQPSQQDWQTYDLAPQQVILCQAATPLCLGPALAGAIGTLSHLARTGLGTHINSPWVLPGWNGYLTLELINSGPAFLRIHRGMPVARLLLFRTSGSVAEPIPHRYYGADGRLGSRYADEFPADTYRR